MIQDVIQKLIAGRDLDRDEARAVMDQIMSGGTTDARFLKNICPVIEFGPCNATMHKRDEAIALADLDALVGIYERTARAALAL